MKDQLAQLIEAYAAARFSGNTLLQQFASAQLQGLLDQVDVVRIEPSTEDTDGAEAKPESKPRAKPEPKPEAA